MSRWRLADTKVEVQKETRHREAENTEHQVNTGYFHTGELHEIEGHVPGHWRSDPQINPAAQRVPRDLSGAGRCEDDQFDDGREDAFRPSGRYSASSRPGESHLQAAQHMPAGYGDEYR
ncbi:hypothetical protein ACFWB2_31890 [Streptomyces virginiae]|uniref:hypothetical protein n=1 Tax=Streptomyces virginiae TaxID=1961 RepID=UPI0036C2D4DC